MFGPRHHPAFGCEFAPGQVAEDAAAGSRLGTRARRPSSVSTNSGTTGVATICECVWPSDAPASAPTFLKIEA